MPETYFGKCAMCRCFNLYDKYCSGSKKYKCVLHNRYYEYDEKACNKFVGDSGRTCRDVDKAREGRL